MNTFYHGSPCLFGAFALTNVGGWYRYQVWIRLLESNNAVF